jgi:hypothetical protein
MKAWQKILTAGVGPAFLFGCSGSGGEDNGGGDRADQEVASKKCSDVLRDFSHTDKEGTEDGATLVNRLNDHFANLVLKPSTTNCPMSFSAVMKALGGSFQAAVVSDRAFLLRDGATGSGLNYNQNAAGGTMDPPRDTPHSTDPATRQPEFGYRLILSRDMSKEGAQTIPPTSELFITPPIGMRIGDPRLPLSIELISFDKTAGVYNYYTVEQSEIVHVAGDPKSDHLCIADKSGKLPPDCTKADDEAVWEYHGSSLDFALKGPGLDGAARFCANCHPGGSLNMKELQAPWLHWDLGDDMPGHQKFMAQVNTQLRGEGVSNVTIQPITGISLEGLVENGNFQLWNPNKISIYTTGKSTQGGTPPASTPKPTMFDLLKPLFCTVEMQMFQGSSGNVQVLQPTINFGLPAGNMQSLIGSVSSVIKQFMKDDFNNPLPNKFDTVFSFYFPGRGVFDDDYVNKLSQKLTGGSNLVQNFIRGVRLVDMTQGILSMPRCGLLQLVKDQPIPSNLDVNAIAKTLVDAVTAAGKSGDPLIDQARADLVANIGNLAQGPTAASTNLGKLQTACQNRADKDGLARDMLKILEFRRTAIAKPTKFEVDFAGGKDANGNFVSAKQFCAARVAEAQAVFGEGDPADICEVIIEHNEALPSVPEGFLDGMEQQRLDFNDCKLKVVQ